MHMDGELVAGTVEQEPRAAGTLKPMMPRAAVIESWNNLAWLGPLDITLAQSCVKLVKYLNQFVYFLF